MVKHHLGSETGNPLPSHGLFTDTASLGSHRTENILFSYLVIYWLIDWLIDWRITQNWKINFKNIYLFVYLFNLFNNSLYRFLLVIIKA